MKTYRLIIPLTIALVVFGTSNCSLFKSSKGDDTLFLKYKFEQGQTISVRNKVKSSIESDNMGQKVLVGINTSAVIDHKVLSLEPDKSMNMEVKFVDMTQDMKSEMGSGDTDFSTWIGKTASYNLTGNGVTDNIQGFESLPKLTTATGEVVGGEVYKQVITGTFFRLPENSVKVGDNWTNVDSIGMPYGSGELLTVSETMYTVAEKIVVEGENCLKIDITGTSKTTGDFEQNGMDMSMDRNATSNGHIIFAYDKGMFLSMEVTSLTNGVIDVPSVGVSIGQKINSVVTTVVDFN